MVYIKTLKGQTMLMPQNICDLIPEDHICYLVESFVESLDYSDFDKLYSGSGSPAYHPRIFLKILIMGLLDRIRSSRRLEKATNENIIYIYLSEKVNPNFRTISNFRKTNPKLIKTTFKKIVEFVKSESLLDLSKIFTDGTIEKANASNKNVMTKEELEIIKNFVEKSLEDWEKQDEIEDEEFGKLRGFDQLPKNSKIKIKNIVKNYIEKTKQKGEDFKADLEIKLDLAKKEIDENNLKKVSLTDVESRFMLNKKGKIELSYNPQITTDKNGFIIANEVVQDANDINQLIPQIEQTQQNIGNLKKGTCVCADAGYDSATNLKELKNKELEGYIPNKELSKKTKEKHKKKVDDYEYDKTTNQIILPDKTKLNFHREFTCKKTGKKFLEFKSADNKTKKTVPEFFEERLEMKEKMKTENGKLISRLRGQIVEPRFGDIKENKGMRSFLTRSCETVGNEFNLICTAVNLKRFYCELKRMAKKTGESFVNIFRNVIKRLVLDSISMI